MDNIIAMDPEFLLWSLIARTRHTLLETRRKELSTYGITPEQARIIYFVYELGSQATLKEIAVNIYRKINTVFQQIKRMEDKGLLRETRDIPGSTAIRFELTEKGLETYELVSRRNTIHEILSILSEEERQQITQILIRLIDKSQSI